MRQGCALHRYSPATYRRLDVGTHAAGNVASTHRRFDSKTLRNGNYGRLVAYDFIVGFPDETDKGIRQSSRLHSGASGLRRLGIFKYSQEEGSRAAKMPGPDSRKNQERALPNGDVASARNRA